MSKNFSQFHNNSASFRNKFIIEILCSLKCFDEPGE